MKFDGASLAAPSLTKMKLHRLSKEVRLTANVALLMAGMPLPAASQCAIVVSVKAITKERSIHVRSLSYPDPGS